MRELDPGLVERRLAFYSGKLRAMAASEDKIRFEMGWCLLAAERELGQSASGLLSLLEDLGYKQGTLATRRWVADNWTRETVVWDLSWTHHRLVTGISPTMGKAAVLALCDKLGFDVEDTSADPRRIMLAITLHLGWTTRELETQVQKLGKAAAGAGDDDAGLPDPTTFETAVSFATAVLLQRYDFLRDPEQARDLALTVSEALTSWERARDVGAGDRDAADFVEAEED